MYNNKLGCFTATGVIATLITLFAIAGFALAGGADISPIRESLMAPEAPIADLIADFWVVWRKQAAL